MYEAFDRYITRHAPQIRPAHIRDFMVRAYEKVETTKETARVTTRMFDLMQRGDFQPSEASVIFDVSDASEILSLVNQQVAASPAENDSSTAIFDTSQPSIVISGVAEAVNISSETSTEQEIPVCGSAELAVSETVFLLADDVAEMERQGARPEVVEVQAKSDKDHRIDDPAPDPEVPSAPNDRTQALSLTEIRAAHTAFQQRYGNEDAAETPTGITQHPLFRWLVLALLVMCLLGGTLVLVLRQRANAENPRPDEVARPESAAHSEAKSMGEADAGS